MAHTRDSFLSHAIWRRTRCYSRATIPAAFTLLALTSAFYGLAPTRADQAVPMLSTHLSCTHTVNGQLLLPVRLTGAKGQKVDANFILDTGVNKCSITDAMADRLGLKSEAGVGDDGRPMVFNGFVARLVHVPLLELGAIPCGPVPCVVLGAKALAATTGQAVDGILGNNLLTALPALINLQSKEVTFFGPGPITADTLRSVGMADATTIPLDDLDNNDTYACMVRIESGGKSLRKDLVLDIGSGETMINGPDARKLGLSTQGKPTSSFTLLSGSTKMYEGKATLIALGNEVPSSNAAAQVRDVTVAYPKGDLPNFLPPHLGRDVLGRYLLLMDFAEKKMYVKPISVSNAPAFVPKIIIGGK